jgi:short-subunit dehydrogenase involved in D-alanine esterification of teichoic acids
MTTNFTAHVALTHAFLPHLLQQSTPTALIYTGTGLSLVPAFALPCYSASKAALDAFIVCIREQLRKTNTSVYHISPGVVQTEIHDAEMGEERGRKFGMPVAQCVDEAWVGLSQGDLDVFVGVVGGSNEEQFKELVGQRDAAIGRLTGLLRQLPM